MSRSAVLPAHMELPPPVPPRGPDVPPRRPAPAVPAQGIDSRFRFHSPDEFPAPEPMSIFKKIYPSTQSSTRRDSRVSGSPPPVMRGSSSANRLSTARKSRPPPPPPESLSTYM